MRCAVTALALLSLIGCSGAASEKPCVTADDLDRGIVVVNAGRNNDIVDIRKRIGPDVILSGAYFSPRENGPSLLTRYHGGFFPIAQTNFDMTSRTTYDPAVETLLPLRDGMRYGHVYEGTVRSETETVIEVLDEGAMVSVGGCDYAAVKLVLDGTTTAQTGQVFETRHEQLYIPALGYTAVGHETDDLTVRRLTEADPALEDF